MTAIVALLGLSQL